MDHKEIAKNLGEIIDSLQTIHIELLYDANTLENAGRYTIAGAVRHRRSLLKDEIEKLDNLVTAIS